MTHLQWKLMPRMTEPGLLQPQREDAPLGQLENAALHEFKDQHRVWAADLAALARDADAAPPSLHTARTDPFTTTSGA